MQASILIKIKSVTFFKMPLTYRVNYFHFICCYISPIFIIYSSLIPTYVITISIHMLNIHRNILCGRNFEYFSEDPLISGKFAAALTKGVQKHPGRGVTIKHFAANNQETNRYASNSIVSERALREIYLKGFGICVRESDPMSLMTSYNLLNGVHTSESRALTEILRSEYGFDGLIMTDWVIGGNLLLAKGSKYGTPDAARVAAAGCSLFMPGGKKDYRQIIAGLKDGTVTERQLRENAEWTLHILERLGKGKK